MSASPTFPTSSWADGAGAAATAIPGVGTALGALQLIQGLGGLLGGKKRKSLAQRQQEKLTKLQIQQIERMVPFLNQMQGAAGQTIDPLLQNALGAGKVAAQFDPAKDTENLTRTYDAAARDSINKDLGSVTANSASKGFTQGTGDSDTGGMIQDTYARRAGMRGNFVANLKSAEPQRYMDITGQGFGRLQNAFGTLDPTGRSQGAAAAAANTAGSIGQMRQFQANQDAQYDPTASIGMIAGGLKKVFPKMPWQ